jgi:methylphosphotriester-DNA--protein-cysteine methyltransferase
MIFHHETPDDELHNLLKQGRIQFAGNVRLKIYGRLDCQAGKRMLREQRIFFATEADAISAGYRPCAICMRAEYLIWKNSS